MQAPNPKARTHARFFEPWLARVLLWAHREVTDAEPDDLLAVTVLLSVFKSVVPFQWCCGFFYSAECSCSPGFNPSATRQKAARLDAPQCYKLLSASDKLVKTLMFSKLPMVGEPSRFAQL